MLQKFKIKSYAFIFFLFLISFGLATTGSDAWNGSLPNTEELQSRIEELQGLQSQLGSSPSTTPSKIAPLGSPTGIYVAQIDSVPEETLRRMKDPLLSLDKKEVDAIKKSGDRWQIRSLGKQTIEAINKEGDNVGARIAQEAMIECTLALETFLDSFESEVSRRYGHLGDVYESRDDDAASEQRRIARALGGGVQQLLCLETEDEECTDRQIHLAIQKMLGIARERMYDVAVRGYFSIGDIVSVVREFSDNDGAQSCGLKPRLDREARPAPREPLILQ